MIYVYVEVKVGDRDSSRGSQDSIASSAPQPTPSEMSHQPPTPHHDSQLKNEDVTSVGNTPVIFFIEIKK